MRKEKVKFNFIKNLVISFLLLFMKLTLFNSSKSTNSAFWTRLVTLFMAEVDL